MVTGRGIIFICSAVKVYNSCCKFQVVSFISIVLSCFCCCIAHRNNFFCLRQQSISSASSIQSEAQTLSGNSGKKVLEAAKLGYANKREESVFSQKLGSPSFSQITSSVSTQVNALKLPHLTALGCCPL